MKCLLWVFDWAGLHEAAGLAVLSQGFPPRNHEIHLPGTKAILQVISCICTCNGAFYSLLGAQAVTSAARYIEIKMLPLRNLDLLNLFIGLSLHPLSPV